MPRFKVGDTVRCKRSGSVGEVAAVSPCGMVGYVVVRFTPASDGYTLPTLWLELAEKEEKPCASR